MQRGDLAALWPALLDMFSIFSPPPLPPPPPPPPWWTIFVGEASKTPSPQRGAPYLVAFLCVFFLNYLWEQFLRLRSHQRLQRVGVPPTVRAALQEVADNEYARAQEYSAAKNSFGFLADAFEALTTCMDLYLNPLIWNTVALRAVLYCGLTAEHEIARMLMSTLIGTPLDLALSMPVSAWRTFVIEERFGFNKHTARTWLSDTLKSAAVGTVVSFVMMAPLIVVLRNLHERAWLVAWVVVTCIVLLFNMLFPVWIAPLFNTFRPLPEGPVRSAIEKLVTASGIRAQKIFEVDGSRQSAHSNAYVTGFFGTKRIVVYDTLVTHLDGNVEDICAVVAHEIGHAKLHHNYMQLCFVTLQLFATFFTYGMCAEDPNLVGDFGFKGAPCAYLRLHAFFLLYNSAVSPILGPLMNAFTRALEFSADRYSVSLGYDLRPALARISKKNLSDADPDPLVSLCHHSHPTIVQRYEALSAELEKKAKRE